MKKKIKGVLVNPNNKQIATIEHIEDTSIRDVLDCDYTQLVSRAFANDKNYAIICDEEGKLKPNQKVSIITRCFSLEGSVIEYFVGKCFICKVHPKKGLISLTSQDITDILSTSATIEIDGNKCMVLQCYI